MHVPSFNIASFPLWPATYQMHESGAANPFLKMWKLAYLVVKGLHVFLFSNHLNSGKKGARKSSTRGCSQSTLAPGSKFIPRYLHGLAVMLSVVP